MPHPDSTHRIDDAHPRIETGPFEPATSRDEVRLGGLGRGEGIESPFCRTAGGIAYGAWLRLELNGRLSGGQQGDVAQRWGRGNARSQVDRYRVRPPCHYAGGTRR